MQINIDDTAARTSLVPIHYNRMPQNNDTTASKML
jgi:hypothetical protein